MNAGTLICVHVILRSRSAQWYGDALRRHPQANSPEADEGKPHPPSPYNMRLSIVLIHNIGLLAYNPLLQRRLALCKSFNPHAILSRLPIPRHAPYLLGHDRDTCDLWVLGCAKCLSELHSRGSVLGSHDSWILPQLEGIVVFQCVHAYRYRPRHLDYPHPGPSCPRATKEAKARPDIDLCSRWIVRLDRLSSFLI